jgi:hypothetical protein
MHHSKFAAGIIFLHIILEKEPYYEQKTCHLLHEEIPPINKRTIAAVFRDSRSMN